MMVAGVPVATEDVLWLVDQLGHCDTSTCLVSAIERQEGTRAPIPVALDDEDLATILIALNDPPKGLAALRGVLLRELT